MLGRERNRGNVVPAPLLQPFRPAALGLHACACAWEHTAGPMDEACTPIHIPPRADVAQTRLAPRGILPGDEAPPGGKRPPVLKDRAMAHGGHEGGGGDSAHACHLHEALGRVALLRQLSEAPIIREDPWVHIPAPLVPGSDALTGQPREPIIRVCQDSRSGPPQACDAVRDDHPIFRQPPAHRIRQCRPVPYE